MRDQIDCASALSHTDRSTPARARQFRLYGLLNGLMTR